MATEIKNLEELKNHINNDFDEDSAGDLHTELEFTAHTLLLHKANVFAFLSDEYDVSIKEENVPQLLIDLEKHL
jgi:hypothetical protein